MLDAGISGSDRFSLRRAGSKRPASFAAKAGDSLNTWLVKVVRAATNEHAIEVDLDLSSLPFGGFDPFRKGKGDRRMTGWL